MNKNLSDKDKKDWQDFIKNDDKLEDKDLKYYKSNIEYKEQSIDLHGYTLEEANKKISNFIENCYEKKIIKLNIITGKGSRSKNKLNPYQSVDLSILKYSVPNYIKSNLNLLKMIKNLDMESVEDPTKGNFSLTLKLKSKE